MSWFNWFGKTEVVSDVGKTSDELVDEFVDFDELNPKPDPEKIKANQERIDELISIGTQMAFNGANIGDISVVIKQYKEDEREYLVKGFCAALNEKMEAKKWE